MREPIRFCVWNGQFFPGNQWCFFFFFEKLQCMMCPCILKAFCAPLVWPVWDRSELVAKAFNNSNKSHDSKKSHGNTKSSCSLTETQGAETWRWTFCAWQNSVLLAEVLQGTTPSPIFLSIRAFGIYPWRHGSTRKKRQKGGEPELIPSLVLRVLLVTMVKYMYLAWGLRSACAELLVIVMDCGTFLAGLKGKISTAVDECAVNGNHFRLF